MSSKDLKAAAKLMDKAGSIILTAHHRPDGDAAGSLLGLAITLRRMGKEVFVFSNDPLRPNFAFLPGAEMVKTSPPQDLERWDLLVMLDCHEADRIGPHGPAMVAKAKALCILDHHLGEGPCRHGMGQEDRPCVQFIDSEACATGAICLRLLEAAGWPVSPEAATCFYTAIMTDTGGFAYSNTTARTFDTARRLVELGADPYEVSATVFESRKLGQLKLMAEAISGMELHHGGLMAVMQVTPEMFSRHGCDESDTDEFVAYARSVQGVEMAVLVKEFTPGRISVSLRSKFFANVQELARHYGGGGHYHAAGFKLEADRREVIEDLVARAAAYLRPEATTAAGGRS